MRITYFALKELAVVDGIRVPGDLVPEAAEWPFLHGYLRDGLVAAVLVATLPESSQKVLSEWEADQEAQRAGAPTDQPVPTPQASSTTGNSPAANKTTTKQKEQVS